MTPHISINKLKIISFIAFFCFISFYFGAASASAQDIEAKISVISLRDASASSVSSKVHVEGKLIDLEKNGANLQIAFLQDYADVFRLDERIENLSLFDASGAKIEFKKLAAGVYQAQKPYVAFAYDVETSAMGNPATSAAHVSWINEVAGGGLLMPNDLLPEWKSKNSISAKLTIDVPTNWTVATSEIRSGKNTFFVKDIAKTIFFIGEKAREKEVRINKSTLNLTIAGDEWQFTDEEALAMANSIFEEYQNLFGATPVEKAQIFLLPFPKKTSRTDRWRAETRGRTVTIISDAVPLKSQALQRLHEQLRHEIFHLWIPNALKLSGNYDWFFEGFAVYQALKTGVELNQIRFEDYLDTLGQAFDMARNQNASLIEISRNRWNPAAAASGARNSVYPKGMIAAFLCDAALLRESRGKRSIRDVFRSVFQKYSVSGSEQQDARAAILNVLKSYPELVPIVEKYIEGSGKIDWQNELNAFGIEAVAGDSATKLKVSDNLNGRQKDLLEKLGYNQWRKLLQRKK